MKRSRGSYILVVEDEKDIRELIRYNLRQENFEVTGVATGPKALKAIKRRTPILILLDLMLPGISGLDLCRILKDSPTNCDIPIIMVTAKGEDVDVVKGLEYGADDYITKPFSPKVLVARVKSLLRRQSANGPNEGEVLRYKDLTIHPGRFEVIAGGSVLSLTHTEFQILHFLACRPGWVYTRYQIIDGVRGRDYIVTDRSVDVTIVSLRKKLGSRSDCIRTVRGVGYKFVEPA